MRSRASGAAFLHASFCCFCERALALSELRLFPISLTQIPKFGIVLILVVVLVLGALGFRDRKETDVPQLICSVSLIAKRSGFSRTTTSTRTTPQIRNLGSMRCSPYSDVRRRIARERVPTSRNGIS